ncbi:MAG TPA: hypothetical protein VFY93_05650 [Planctomycetota bacterium]|nr:hypothetical protein [Planctomycetota bacterium]
MIAVRDDTVACLGGWRGDGLCVSRGGGPLVRVADLGWDGAKETTPQRRLLLRDGDLFVLEPVSGHLLLPPLRARRFDLEGRELGVEEGADPGPALLSFHARTVEGRSRVTRCGIDAATGRPTLAEEDLDADLSTPLAECSGIPLVQSGVVHYPVRGRGLFRGAERLFEGDPGIAQAIGGDVVCAGHQDDKPGVWAGGAWHRLAGRRLFPGWRAPLSPLAVPVGASLLVLRREGGELPDLGGAKGRLPPGIYGALFLLGGRPWALREAESPSLVAVEV